MSLDAPAAASLQNAATTESAFQQFFDGGGLNDPPDAGNEPPPREQAPAAAPPAAASPPAAAAPDPGAPDPAAPAAGDPAADEGPEYQSLEDYLGKNSLEASSFYELPVTVKIDGKTAQVKLSDVVKSYQLEGHVHAKSVAVAEQQRALEAERVQAQQFVAQQLTAAQALGQLAQRELMGQYQNINWQQLRVDNPAEWAALQQEFNQRAAGIQQHLAQINEAQRQQSLAQQQEIAKALPAEQEKLYEARPEWRDPAKFTQARSQMSAVAKQVGFSDAELSNVFDHRYMVILDMAARYAALQAQSTQAVKRVRAAPVVAQPGARIQRDPKASAFKQAVEAMKRDPRNEDAQAAAFSHFA